MSRNSALNQQVQQAIADFEIWSEKNRSNDVEAFLAANELTESVANEVRKNAAQAQPIDELVNDRAIDAGDFLETQAMTMSPGVEGDVPQQIGRYRVDRVLGKGGFGLVYLAYDGQLQRSVAVKVPHAQLVSRPRDAEAYLSEARTVANLDHSNIVPVFDVGQTDDFPCFVVSKYIEGTDLAAKLKHERPGIKEASELVATVAEALHHAHKHGLVHRDVKPGNILLGNDGKAYIVDFGLALKEQDMGKGPAYAGTPAYMSPEQARGEGHRVDGRSDIYSLGAVLYELLVGRRTFDAETQVQLLQQITSQEVKPPRQIDDSVPKELERICLKALSKRASDRYTTALDMAEDLRHFVQNEPADSLARTGIQAPVLLVGTDSTKIGVGSDTPKFDSDSRPVMVVPKGLRSFDAHDAEFFLELLPGPRDRDGLPDCLRFWKTRIEERDADQTFSVGLIYGPSGCGKSSMVKAGLIPRLSEDVIPIYIEATPDGTETRLLHGLRKNCSSLDNSLNLCRILASMRQGHGVAAGKKVLIVLDQFEQWLHAKNEEDNTELVQALRQCDGGRVQCIVMVRDDFWMAATRFMSELEVRLVEAHNSAAVDLFSVRHAERVLSAFGRAFGALPDESKTMSKDQKEFLKKSVANMAVDGKVICVRLALFAEMMKGKEWTSTALNEIGGIHGVGEMFLEDTFSASTAPPEHRYHQKAARAVLNALLPGSGADIKGEMKSYNELLQASEYTNRPNDFDKLLRILDSEVRLISPTDPEGVEGDGKDSHHTSPTTHHLPLTARYYQLTHDYLVHSLRQWLTRKQRETRRGRAELRLAELSAMWNLETENRYLPSLVEWLNIRFFSEKKKWSHLQRTMMRRSFWIHTRRMTIGVASVVALVLLLYVRSEKPLQIFSNRNRQPSARMHAFDVLDLDGKGVLETVKRTLLNEDQNDIIKHSLGKIRGRARKIAERPSEGTTGRNEILELMKGLVSRKPDSRRNGPPVDLLDSIRAEAFEIYLRLAEPSDVIKMIQSEIRDDLAAPETNRSMLRYMEQLSVAPDLAEQLANIVSEQADQKLVVATLIAWNKCSVEVLTRSLQNLSSPVREQFFKHMIQLINDERTRNEALTFLNHLPADCLLDYFFDATSDNLKDAAKDSLLPYAANTSPQRVDEIGDEVEKRILDLVKRDSNGNIQFGYSSELEYLILGIGELEAEGKTSRDPSFEVVAEILRQRKQAEGWLDSVINSFGVFYPRHKDSVDPTTLSIIREILVDSKIENRIAAANTLGLIGDQESLPLLKKIVNEEKDKLVLCKIAIENLGLLAASDRNVAESSVIPLLQELFLNAEEPEFNIRKPALVAFGQLANPDQVMTIAPLLLDSRFEGLAITAVQQIIVNGGDEAGVAVEKLLPFLVKQYQGQESLYAATSILIFVDFPNSFVRERNVSDAAKSVAVALAKAAALDPDDDIRNFAGQSFEKISIVFRPKLETKIQPSANVETRTRQFEAWVQWWNSKKDHLQLTLDKHER